MSLLTYLVSLNLSRFSLLNLFLLTYLVSLYLTLTTKDENTNRTEKETDRQTLSTNRIETDRQIKTDEQTDEIS